MCQKEILSMLMFICRKCDFSICKSCAQLPNQWHHPLHPHHTSVLCYKDIVSCNACNQMEPGYGYECNECEFNLHLKCSSLNPISKKDSSIKYDHQHPLIVCDNPCGYDFKCFRCEAIIEDDVYLCLDCHCMLDSWCALQPREIKHPFHLEHSLKLYNKHPLHSYHCSLCSRVFDSHTMVYSCPPCKFTVDVHCATLVPSTSKDSTPDGIIHEGRTEIRPETHPHCLILCSTNFKNFASKCYGCGLRFEDASIYICIECGILLHKSCASLPREISHPFHPQHNLTLFENSINRRVYTSYYCSCCGDGSGEFVYICKHCNVVLDVKCGTAKLQTIMSRIHQHPLAYFNIETRRLACHFCGDRGTRNFFRCVNCEFNVHDHCFPSLPQRIKHDCHCDPLDFTKDRILDVPDGDEDQEVYCSACEERRDLNDPCYFCKECHYVADVHCVISEILPYLQSDPEVFDVEAKDKDEDSEVSSDQDGKEEVGDPEALRELDGEIGVLEEEIDEMAEELKQLYETRIQRVSTMLRLVKNKLRMTGHSDETLQLLSYEKYLSRRFGYV